MVRAASWKRIALVVAAATVLRLTVAAGLAVASGGSDNSAVNGSVKQIAGVVEATGAPCNACDDGYSSVRLSTGVYRVSFPAGAWTKGGTFRAPVITAFNGADVRGRVIGAGFFADGSTTFRASFVDAAGTPADTAWFFTVTQA
jgi:hypothetical protein